MALITVTARFNGAIIGSHGMVYWSEGSVFPGPNTTLIQGGTVLEDFSSGVSAAGTLTSTGTYTQSFQSENLQNTTPYAAVWDGPGITSTTLP